MKTKVDMRGVLAIAIASLCCLASTCDIYDGPLVYSPQELIGKNEIVAVGKFVSADTVADLGKVKFLGDSCHCYVVDYTYTPVRFIKGSGLVDSLHLWDFECCNKSPCIDVFGFHKELDYLVYGTLIDSAMELPIVAQSISSRYFTGGELTESERAESLLIAGLAHSKELSYMLEKKRQHGMVFAGTDGDLGTLYAYANPGLAYIDSKGTFQLIAAVQYLRAVDSAAIALKTE
jgi:hypothetical protein